MNYNENGATKTMIEWIIPLSLIGLIILGIQLKNYKYPSQIQKEIINEFNKEWEQIKMTEKQFTDIEVGADTGRVRLYNGINFVEYSSSELLDLLNELHEENKKLKQVNEMLQMDFAITERNLMRENEQLKQKNKN